MWRFTSNLIESKLFSHEKGALTGAISAKKGRFELTHKGKPVPFNWFIVNIKGSAIAVKNGLTQLVNSIATSSIVTALNISKRDNIEISFFFGGDGATLMVPESIIAGFR